MLCRPMAGSCASVSARKDIAVGQDPTDDQADWAPVTFETIPSRADLEFETIDLIETGGITNADQIRDRIRRKRKLVVQQATGRGNEAPSSKFVNEHAFV